MGEKIKVGIVGCGFVGVVLRNGGCDAIPL